MKILVASDGSGHALNAAKFAATIAADLRSDSIVTLISVHDDVAFRHASQFVGRSEVENYLRERSREELQPAREVLDASGIRHDMAILIGHVVDEIVAFADAGGYDMIVLGSKGRSGIADLLIGSIAQRVLATARQPVLLVK
jgi:nucleotide-binding universal stress UspA family protein